MQLACSKYFIFLIINNHYLVSHIVLAAIYIAWKGVRDHQYFFIPDNEDEGIIKKKGQGNSGNNVNVFF